MPIKTIISIIFILFYLSIIFFLLIHIQYITGISLCVIYILVSRLFENLYKINTIDVGCDGGGGGGFFYIKKNI